MGKMGKIVSRAWGVEQSAIDSTPKITYVIGGELCLENHGGIETVSENELRFGSGISVIGTRLNVEWVERDYVIITGVLSGIRFEKN